MLYQLSYASNTGRENRTLGFSLEGRSVAITPYQQCRRRESNPHVARTLDSKSSAATSYATTAIEVFTDSSDGLCEAFVGSTTAGSEQGIKVLIGWFFLGVHTQPATIGFNSRNQQVSTLHNQKGGGGGIRTHYTQSMSDDGIQNRLFPINSPPERVAGVEPALIEWKSIVLKAADTTPALWILAHRYSSPHE